MLYKLTNKTQSLGKICVKNNEFDIVTDGVTTVTLDATSSPKQLDLMFMIDTTGSMGDELVYIQSEVVDILNRVKEFNTYDNDNNFINVVLPAPFVPSKEKSSPL